VGGKGKKLARAKKSVIEASRVVVFGKGKGGGLPPPQPPSPLALLVDFSLLFHPCFLPFFPLWSLFPG